MCTITTAAVSGPMHAARSAGSIAIVCGSQSTKRSVAPACTAAAAVAKKVLAGTIDLASLDAEGAQDDLERGGAGAHRDRVLRAVTRGERVFELAADRAERELPGGQCFVDAREDLGPVFGGEQDSGRGHAHGRRI